MAELVKLSVGVAVVLEAALAWLAQTFGAVYVLVGIVGGLMLAHMFAADAEARVAAQ